MTCAVIGSAGTVGSALVEHLACLGHEVLGVDLDTRLTLEDAAGRADAVFIVTLPIEGVAWLIGRAARSMKPGGLIVHGTSIEDPASPYGIDPAVVTSAGLDLCHLHFHFRPEVPLRRTLLGQNVSVSHHGEARWVDWVKEQFAPFGPVVYQLAPGEHDRLTSTSQLVHMTISALVADLWAETEPATLERGIRLGGPPCRTLVRTVLRTALVSNAAASILVNHPDTPQVLDRLAQALAKLRGRVGQRKEADLSSSLSASRALIPSDEVARWDFETNQLARYEADIRKGHIRFDFGPDHNQVGLLGRILAEFDSRGVDKTSTIAQVNPDGGCTILIGVREDSAGAEEARRVVEGWAGAGS